MTDLAARFMRLYTGAVADVLDSIGYRDQVLPAALAPVTKEMKIAGPAFPGRGEPTKDITHNDTAHRLAMLESVTPGSVSIWACGGHDASAHWGEIMTRAVAARGCVGAVVDGGLRDTGFILDLQFPIFCRFRSPASSIGRWDIIEWNCDIQIGSTTIHPGDWVFGDIDGVVIIPADLVTDVIAKTEETVLREEKMRVDLEAGDRPSKVFERHGSF